VQEGPQRGRQLLRAFHMQARSLALHKSHNIAGTEMRERHAALPEPSREEPPDKRDVVGDGRRSQDAFVAQVRFERMRLVLNLSQSARWLLLCRNDTLVLQEPEELSERRGILAADLDAAGATLQISGPMLGRDATHGHGLLSKPPAKTGREVHRVKPIRS